MINYDFTFDENLNKHIIDGDWIEIIGEIKKKGNNISLEHCRVISTWDTAEAVFNQIIVNQHVHQLEIDAVLKAIAEEEKEAALEKAAGFENLVYAREILPMTPKQLKKYGRELAGYSFHSVFQITKVKESTLEAKLDPAKGNADFIFNFKGKGDLRNALTEGDFMEIKGIIEDEGFLGGVKYDACMVVNTGEKAQEVLDFITEKENEEQDRIDQIIKKSEQSAMETDTPLLWSFSL